MDKKVQWSLVGAVWVLFLGVLALGWLYLQKAAAPIGAQNSADPSVASKAESGSRRLDPVTKTELVLEADTPHVRYQGRDYYFSTALDERGRDHKTLFLMDPEFYLSGVSSFKSQPTPPATVPEGASSTGKAP